VSSHFYNWPVMCFDLLANSVHSIIFSVLDIRMHVYEARLIMHVH
jgi:hypothetical protein